MKVFFYDKTFEGLLSVVFEAYHLKIFPDVLLGDGDPPPLLVEEIIRVKTAEEKAARVWAGLTKKLSALGLNCIIYSWLLEERGADELIFRYIRKIFAQVSETDFADPDVLNLKKAASKVNREKHHLIEFVRFQKTVDDLYFAPISPAYNALPLILDHFAERFADQKWIIYDLNRDYGYYYNLKNTVEINLGASANQLGVRLNEQCLAPDEKLFQDLWRAYFKAVSIEERINPKLQKQHMPKRFWPFLTEIK